jgi:hypothetical protein
VRPLPAARAPWRAPAAARREAAVARGARAGTASEGDAGRAGRGSGDGVRFLYIALKDAAGLSAATAPALFQYLSSA